ncbi:MAG: Trk system potassium transporter TrkA [Bacteroidales bacterium]|nr:Trk system potassium transporter TrkA [Bacteroidales bacterium]
MKIIIVGAGAVGTHLAKLLSREDQDIILMDNDEEKLEVLSTYNLMTIVGSPTSIKDLKEAGVKHADLFIAVTPYESQNITACTLAANLGAAKTLARIDNYEYLKPENRDFFKKLGVDELIYPEMLAAQEIVTALKKAWVRQWFELCGGALILIGVKLRENALIVNHRLNELSGGNNFYHIAAIKRKDNIIIPKGTDKILPNDLVYFTTTKDHISDIRILAGKEETEIKKVMIMGGSRIAIRTADYAPDYMQIKIIETDRNKSLKLVEKIDDADIILGDGRDPELLKEEGINEVDAFIALTDSSETNILACLSAKGFGVSKTIAEVENLTYISMAENLNIGSVINKKLITASRIYQLLLAADVSNVKCLTLANAEVAELIAKPGSKITQSQVKDLALPKDLTIGGLIRNGVGLMVNGNTQIMPYDHVLIFCLDTAIKKIEKLFN